jgi:hypothetical protein
VISWANRKSLSAQRREDEEQGKYRSEAETH